MAKVEQQFRIAEIDVSKIATDERIAGIFRFESSGVLRGSQLLFIADIHSSLYVYERLLDVLNETAEQARHLVVGVSQDPVVRFEKLIQRMNEALAAFVEEEAAPLNWKRINMFLIELSEGHLCFTGVGRLMNAFFQKQPDGSFRSFDLLGSLDEPTDLDPKKPFAALVCGDVRPGDVLIVGTDNLERLRGELQFKERLTTLPPVSAALEIRQDLERRGIPDHFVAAVISCQEVTVPTAEDTAAASRESADRSTSSIEKLRETEQKATEHLSPVVAPLSSLPAIGRAGTRVKRLLSIFSVFTQTSKPSVDPVSLAGMRGMNAGYGNSFTKRKKILTATIGGGILLLLVAGLVWKEISRRKAEEALWASTFAQATDQRNRAEADLLYGNDARAKTEIATAEQSLQGLPVNTDSRRKQLEKLRADITGLKDKLKKLVQTDNVTELTTLAAPDGSLAAPVLSGDIAYAVDNATGAILKANLLNHAVKTIRIPGVSEKIVAGVDGKDHVLFATANGKLFALKKSSDEVSAMPWTHSRSSSTADVVLYASKLYALDTQKQQVWRSANAGGSFGGDAAYVKATSETLTNAVSLAIDQSVYVLKSDGAVNRYYAGGLEGFSLPAIDPPLASGASIWTELDSEYIAIADTDKKRIVLFDKNGALKAQVVSSQLSNPRDLDLDEATKRMIVVDGNRLLLVPMP